MAGGRCPETPRQKMIGMMYLFLTAMLALNVSTMVLEAFRDIENSLQSTLLTIEEKNRRVYDEIATQAVQDEEYQALAEIANQVESRSNNLVDEIENIKLMIINHSSGAGYDDIELAVSEVQKLDDLYAARDIMVEGYGEAAGIPQGPMIKEMIDDHRVFLLSLIADQEGSPLYQSINENLSTFQKIDPRDELTFEWEEAISFNMPMMATIALLTKMQADIRNAEGDILNHLIMEIEGGVDIRITSLEGLVSAPKSFIIRGQEYESRIFLGARDSTMDPIVYLRESPPFWDSTLNADGTVSYELHGGEQNYEKISSTEGYATYAKQANVSGEFTYGGLIAYQTRRGLEYYPYTSTYTVGQAGATVAASEMNVFYRGLRNPIDVSVSGYPEESINIRPSAGQIGRDGRGRYITIPASFTGDEVRINVSARASDGTTGSWSSAFRIMDVPTPVITVRGRRSGERIPRGLAARADNRLEAGIGDQFFPLEGLEYRVVSFGYMRTVRGVNTPASNPGATFSNELVSYLGSVASGHEITFSEIMVETPSGRQRMPFSYTFIVE